MEPKLFRFRTRNILIFANVLLILLGMCIFAYGLFILCSNQGGMNPSLFNFMGTLAMLYGFIISSLSHMSHRSLFVRGKVHEFWTGQRAIKLVLFLIVIITLAEIVFFGITYWTYLNLLTVHDNIEQDEINEVIAVPLYADEINLSDTFNNFFFQATSSCSSATTWFWAWIDANCPASMNRDACTACDKSSITFCGANERLCESLSKESIACPYAACRESVVLLAIYRLVGPLCALLLFLIVMHVAVIVLQTLVLRQPVKDRLRIKVIPVTQAGAHSESNGLVATANSPRSDEQQLDSTIF